MQLRDRTLDEAVGVMGCLLTWSVSNLSNLEGLVLGRLATVTRCLSFLERRGEGCVALSLGATMLSVCLPRFARGLSWITVRAVGHLGLSRL